MSRLALARYTRIRNVVVAKGFYTANANSLRGLWRSIRHPMPRSGPPLKRRPYLRSVVCGTFIRDGAVTALRTRRAPCC